MQYLFKELKKKHVTLQLLWYEYKQNNPDGYQYSYFCELYQKWRKQLDVSLRQEHRAGEKAFIDYAGQTVPIYNPETGKVDLEAQVFIATLGASNYSYAEATFPETARLDQIPHPHPGVLRWGSPDPGARQPEKRCHPSLPLRTRHQSHLSGPGPSLWHHGHSGKARQAQRQGQGGIVGVNRRALDTGRH